jgi:hypothetical protein
MKTTVYFFLKFFQQEQHARAFVAGQLHLNPLAYFKGLEQRDGDGRADRHEAPLAWLRPDQLGAIEFAGVPIEPADLVGPVIIQGMDADALNVLCLYAATAGPFAKISASTLEAFRRHLRVPDKCLSLGPFAVFVHNPRIFISRFVEAVKREGLGLECGLVDYFDPDSFSGSIERPAFVKKQEFEWQREYRFAVKRNVTAPEPYTFKIGPLADICTIVEAATVNDQFTMTLPE